MFLLNRESIDGDSGMVLPISNIQTEISIKKNFSINSEKGKFITKKEDPSWLITSIDLKSIHLINDDTIEIVIDHADSYSYFLGR